MTPSLYTDRYKDTYNKRIDEVFMCWLVTAKLSPINSFGGSFVVAEEYLLALGPRDLCQVADDN